jgi:hypothetical protein
MYWPRFTAADAAVAGLYAFHPTPERVMQPLIAQLAGEALAVGACGEAGGRSLGNVVWPSDLARATFLAAHTAIHHLVRECDCAKLKPCKTLKLYVLDVLHVA